MYKFFFLLMLVLFSRPAHADPVQELRDEIAAIKTAHENQARNLATALNQLQQVLGEFQGLAGKADQSLHLTVEQDKLIKDNQRRLDVLEDKALLLVAQLEEIKAAGLLPPPQALKLKEFREYEKGLSKVNAETFREAITSFKSFITANPESLFAENAQYWIGESFFAMRDYPAAVAEFQKVIQKYPKSGKVPPSLLKQGLAFFEMQSFDEAKAFLTKLISRHPSSEAAILATEKIGEINRVLELKAKEAVERKENL